MGVAQAPLKPVTNPILDQCTNCSDASAKHHGAARDLASYVQ